MAVWAVAVVAERVVAAEAEVAPDQAAAVVEVAVRVVVLQAAEAVVARSRITLQTCSPRMTAAITERSH